MRIGEIQQFCKLPEDGQSLMRAHHRTQSVKLARTIADLDGREKIQSVHLAEVLHAAQSPKPNVQHNVMV
jgi:predicted ATPase with chaperone activity